MARRWVLSLHHPILFPVTTIIIMELFINKMRRLKGIRKMIVIEEAWKAIASANMASYIKYLYKTVRKFFGEAVVVTQEVEDIISSAIVKDSIINNSDCKILLDQRKLFRAFDKLHSNAAAPCRRTDLQVTEVHILKEAFLHYRKSDTVFRIGTACCAANALIIAFTVIRADNSAVFAHLLNHP